RPPPSGIPSRRRPRACARLLSLSGVGETAAGGDRFPSLPSEGLLGASRAGAIAAQHHQLPPVGGADDDLHPDRPARQAAQVDRGAPQPSPAPVGTASHGGPLKAGNCGSGAPPPAPVAPISLKQSTARPSASVITEPSPLVCSPTGTKSCGWSKGAAWSRTRGSVSASRN